jgi:hypothetical protein
MGIQAGAGERKKIQQLRMIGMIFFIQALFDGEIVCQEPKIAR